MLARRRHPLDVAAATLLLTVATSSSTAGEVFVRGDINRDGQVSVADVGCFFDTFFFTPRRVACGDAADVNDDGAVSTSPVPIDAFVLLDWLFRTTRVAPLPAPFPFPGADPTTDVLDCRVGAAGGPPAPTPGFGVSWQMPRALSPGDDGAEFVVLATTRSAVLTFSIAYRVRKSVLENLRVELAGPFEPGRGPPPVAPPIFRSIVLPSADPNFSLLEVALIFVEQVPGTWAVIEFEATRGAVANLPLLRVVADVRDDAPIGRELTLFVPAEPEDFVAAGAFVHGVQNEAGGIGDQAGNGFQLVADDGGGVIIFDGEEFLRGDSNTSFAVDISDATFTLSYLFQGGPAPVCFDPADANDDAQIDISDATFTLSYLFFGTDAPPDPGPVACGYDLTLDPFRECPDICN